MSFFSDLFSGNFSNLGHDLAPSNIFNDTVSSFENQPGWAQGLELAAPLAIAAPFALPEIGAAFGADVAATAAPAALGFAGDVAGGATDLSAFLLDPAAVAGGAEAGAVPADALSLAAPAAAGGGAGSALPLTAGGLIDTGAAGMPGVTAGGFDLATIGPGAPVAAGAAGTPAAAGGGVLDTLTNALAPTANFLKTTAPIAGAAGLGFNLYEGYQQKKQLDALNARETALANNAAAEAAAAKKSAQPLISSGTTLMSYLTTNTLPPQFQSMIDQTIASARAATIQGYASRGMSTNPQQNSALNQDLIALSEQADTLKANLESTLSTAGNQMVQTANQLLSTGISATSLAAEIPIQMAKLNDSLNRSMAQAVANFAAAVNGGTGNRSNTGLQAPTNIVGTSGNLNFG